MTCAREAYDYPDVATPADLTTGETTMRGDLTARVAVRARGTEATTWKMAAEYTGRDLSEVIRELMNSWASDVLIRKALSDRAASARPKAGVR